MKKAIKNIKELQTKIGKCEDCLKKKFSGEDN